MKAKGSKYAPVSLHNAVAGIKAASGTKYVIVGLPCHIQGFRKLEAIDRKFRDKVLDILQSIVRLAEHFT